MSAWNGRLLADTLQSEVPSVDDALALVTEALDGYVYVLDVQSGAVERSARFASVTGWPADATPATAEWWLEQIHPDDRAGLVERFNELARDVTTERTEAVYRVARPDGRWIWLNDRQRFFRHADGSIARILGVSIDITMRMEADERERARDLVLAQQFAELEAIYRHAPVGLCVFDRELRFVRINERLAEMNGVPMAAHIGRHPRDVVPSLAEAAEGLARRVFETGETVRDIHIRGETPACPGVMRDWVEQWFPLFGAEGEVTGINVVAEEVTERVRAEAERRRAEAERERLLEEAQAARAEAERANRIKSEFLAVMSHELRTPLNAIDGYAELLEIGLRGALNEAQLVDVQRIRRSHRHLLGLVNRVLDYARIEGGALRFDMQPLRLASAVEAASAFVQPQAQGRGVELRVGACPDDLWVHADHEKVQQILLNLAGNAIKFTERGGSVEVTCGSDDTSAFVRVSDTGIGIAAEKLSQIFEPFVQLGRGATPPVEGVGLGLAISRQLARGMGGELGVESQPGVGSAFTLTIPREQR